MIEEEVERRLADKIKNVLEHVSKTYGVNMKQLMKDVTLVSANNTMCMGLTVKGQPCKRRSHANGFCHSHQSQKPVVIRTVCTPQASNEHTHDSSILFVQGCPGCKELAPTMI